MYIDLAADHGDVAVVSPVGSAVGLVVGSAVGGAVGSAVGVREQGSTNTPQLGTMQLGPGVKLTLGAMHQPRF